MKAYLPFVLLFVLLFSCKPDEETVYVEVTENITCERTIDPIADVENVAEIEGYTDKQSYYPGESVKLFIHCLTASHSLELIRYGYQDESILTVDTIIGQKQNYDTFSYSWGCEWDETYSLELPSDLSSGIYAVKLRNENSKYAYITFVVKSYETKDIVVLANTNTWQAYNKWSGSSFYDYWENDDIPNSSFVSFMRPNKAVRPYGDKGHLANGELHLLRWMEKNGYDYKLISDKDLHEDPAVLSGAKVLMINCHAEYWSINMFNHMEDFLDSGNDVMYLSGNGVYWKVGLACDKIEVRKKKEKHQYTSGTGGRWKEIGRPEAAVIGVSYDSRGYGTYAPYRVLDASHWVFEGTGLNTGAQFGQEGLNGGGASGWETDKITDDTPDQFEHIAKGTNPDEGGADMVYRKNTSGGQVFSVGSLSYTGSLSEDSVVSQITSNVINRFVAD